MKKIIYATIAGVTLGILFAPARGSETRKKIRDRYRKLAKDLTGHEEQMYERATALAKKNVRDESRDSKKEFNGMVEATPV